MQYVHVSKSSGDNAEITCLQKVHNLHMPSILKLKIIFQCKLFCFKLYVCSLQMMFLSKLYNVKFLSFPSLKYKCACADLFYS